MHAVVSRWVLLLLLVAPAAAHGASRVEEEYQAFDRAIRAELSSMDPTAEPLLDAADSARARGDHARGAELYAQVFERVPRFVHALRRLGREQLELGQRAKAIASLQRAASLERSPENLVALGEALIRAESASDIPFTDLVRARELCREALAINPDDISGLWLRAHLAMLGSMPAELDSAVAGLDRRAPGDVVTLYYGTIAHAMHKDFSKALATLEQARAAGFPQEQYAEIKRSLEAARPKWPLYLGWGGIAAGSWVAGALVLLLAGLVLSGMTLRASERVPPDADVRVSGMEALLRRTYQAVLGLCCAYYYASMPLLLALVLAVGGGIVYGMLAVGHIPVKLLLIVLLVTLVTAWAILSSLLVRVKDEDPGLRIDLEREPALDAELKGIAGRVGTRTVDSVYLTPGTEIAVFERGGLMRQWRGTSERCLILGAGVLDGFRMRPFRAVLAHEYGHFSNRDTAGGGFALAVRRSIVALARQLARSGASGWYNPAWWFVNGFHRLFLRISQGASRLQEVLADRWAATLYGARAFEAGLRHVIERSILFDAHVNATLKEVIEAKAPLANLYRYAPAERGEATEVESQTRAAIDREPSAYDSHPRPADRFRWAHALGVKEETAPDDDALVWDLFTNRTALEEEMTGQVRVAVAHNHGIEIAPPSDAAPTTG